MQAIHNYSTTCLLFSTYSLIHPRPHPHPHPHLFSASPPSQLKSFILQHYTTGRAIFCITLHQFSFVIPHTQLHLNSAKHASHSSRGIISSRVSQHEKISSGSSGSTRTTTNTKSKRETSSSSSSVPSTRSGSGSKPKAASKVKSSIVEYPEQIIRKILPWGSFSQPHFHQAKQALLQSPIISDHEKNLIQHIHWKSTYPTKSQGLKAQQDFADYLEKYDRNLLLTIPAIRPAQLRSLLFLNPVPARDSGNTKAKSKSKSKSKSNSLVTVKPSTVTQAGMGVFAQTFIPRGAPITEYIGIHVKPDDYPTWYDDYMFARNIYGEEPLNWIEGLNKRFGFQPHVLANHPAPPQVTDNDHTTVTDTSNSRKYRIVFGKSLDMGASPEEGVAQLINDHSAIFENQYDNLAQQIRTYIQNIPTKNNVVMLSKGCTVFAVAARDIYPGEELFWTYGVSWWLNQIQRIYRFDLMFIQDSDTNKLTSQALNMLQQLSEQFLEPEQEAIGRSGANTVEKVVPLEEVDPNRRSFQAYTEEERETYLDFYNVLIDYAQL